MSTLLPPTSIYTIIIGGFFILVLARRLFCILARCIESPRLHMWLYQHLESHIIRRTNLTPPVSRRDLLLQCLYWVGTGCYNFIGASTTQEVSDRAIVATAFNTMPLLLGDRLDLAAQILTFSRRTYQNIHSTVGLMTVVQMVLHIILQQMTRRLDFGTSKDCYRLIVSSRRFVRNRNRSENANVLILGCRILVVHGAYQHPCSTPPLFRSFRFYPPLYDGSTRVQLMDVHRTRYNPTFISIHQHRSI